jgi:hypothetical protein
VKRLGQRGTRHAAALGLAELTDALCLVVSEESGTVSIAHNADIEVVSNPEKLSLTLEGFYQEISPGRKTGNWKDLFKKNVRQKIIAVGLAMSLWFVLIHGSKLTYKTFMVPVTYTDLTKPWIMKIIAPDQVEMTFRGSRRAFYFLKPGEIKLLLQLKMIKGRQRIRISSTDAFFPKFLFLEDIDPRVVTVYLDEAPENQTQEPPSSPK